MQFYAGFADSPLEDARELGRVCPITYGETDKPLAIAKGWNYLGRVKANGASSPHWPTRNGSIGGLCITELGERL